MKQLIRFIKNRLSIYRLFSPDFSDAFKDGLREWNKEMGYQKRNGKTTNQKNRE